MSDPSKSNGPDSIVTLDSLPPGSLSMSQIDALSEADSVEIAAPLVIDTTTDRVTHFDLVYDDTHHYLGWNPTDDQWERILVVVDTKDELVVESAVTISTTETGPPPIKLDPSENPEIEDIVKYVWQYVEHTYPDTDNLCNVMDEALKELSADDG